MAQANLLARGLHLFLTSFVPVLLIGTISVSGYPSLSALALEPESNTLLAVGSKVDGFSLTDYQGKEWTLGDFQSKEAIVFAFIGTQCPLAKLYSAKLVELEQQYRDRGIAFVAVDSNTQDSLAEMAAHARKFGIDFAFLKDPSQKLADQMGVTRTPEVCVIDSESKIRYRGRIDDQFGIGYTKDVATKKELVEAIDAILNKRDVANTTTSASGCLIGRGPRDAVKADLAVTYADQVSRILQSRCVSCHRPGEIGPMDLGNYEDASAWADMIVEVIDEGRMPPWHASQSHGSFKNDRRMPAEEIAAVKNWARAGAIRGDASKEPTPLKFVEGWQLPREPERRQMLHGRRLHGRA